MLRYLNKSSILCLLFVLLGYHDSNAQTLAELKRVAANYKSIANFSQKLSVYFYATESATSPQLITQGFIEKNGDLSRSVYDGRETLMGKDFIIMVDYANQTVYYSPQSKKGNSANSSIGTEVLDSIFLSKYTVTAKKLDETFSMYTFKPKIKNLEIAYLKMKINHISHTFSSIEYIYNGAVKFQKVLIKYATMNQSPQFSPKNFTETNYIVGKQKQARLAPKYSNYKLVNSFNYDPKEMLIEK